MKKLFIILSFFVNLSVCMANELVEEQAILPEIEVKKEIIDEIKVRVNGVNITKSFLEKPQAVMGGHLLSLDDAINTELLFQKAVDRKLLPTPAEVERQIANLKINNGIAHLTDEELEEELKQEGLSFNEYKNQIARYIAIERLKGAEFSERVVVTTQEIEGFYKKNPSWSEAKYCINICELSFDDIDGDGNLKEKEDAEANNIVLDNRNWDDLGWILKKDLSSSLSFVENMKAGEISKPVKIGDTFQLVKLIDKSEKFLRSLNDRYSEIEMVLQTKKRTQFEEVFEKELRADASIIYLA
ncbi:MAG: hypothetical protein ABIF12_00605 [bacterium]